MTGPRHPAPPPPTRRRSGCPTPAGRPHLLLALVLAPLLALAALLAASRVEADDRPSEEQVKAAIIVSITRATEWPAGTFKEGRKTFVIGLLGRDTLGERATALFAENAAARGHSVLFKVVNEEAEARACHALFVPRAERRRARELLERLRTAPILTIGESEDFLDQNGMVNLVAKDGAMKFEVNLNPVKAANLRIPAKVLGSALAVRGKYEL